MVEIDDCIKARSFITSLKVLDNKNIAFATKLHGVKISTSQDCSVILNFANEYLNSSTTAICFSNDGTLLAFANEKIIYIVNLNSKDIIKTINTENEPIQLLTFDDSSTHIIAGSSNGRVLHYRVDGLSLLCRLCSFPYNREENVNIRQNYVSAFVFNKNILAVTGYGGTIHIIDIHSRANSIVLENSKARTNALCFLDDDTLLSGNFDGIIKIFSLKDKKVLKQVDSGLNRIRQIIILPNPNFAAICSNANYITILDLRSCKIVHQNYIEFDEIVTRIAVLDEDTIIVSLKSGKINKVKLTSVKKLNSLITHNSLEKAFLLTQDDYMLQDTNEYIKLESLYSNLYNQATKALINQNIALATELLSPFKSLKSKQKEITLLFLAFKNYHRLKVFFLDKKYTLAYAICAKYPELENTPIYRKMEDVFKEIFKNAQRQVLLQQPHNAKALLGEYITIPAKRSMIELILKQNKEFIQFIVAVDKNEYAKASSLSNRNKTLVQIPSYASLTKRLDKHIQEIKAFLKQGDTDNAYKVLELIKDVVHLKSISRILKNEAKNIELLQKYYADNDFKSCFEELDKYPHLKTTQLGIMLSDYWNKTMHTCEVYALKGNVNEIKKTLGELISLEGRLNKIGDLFRVAFHIRIKTYIFKKAYQNAEKTIYSYIDTFGNDSEIRTLMNKFETKSKKKLAITHNSLNAPTRDSWINSSLIIDNSD